MNFLEAWEELDNLSQDSITQQPSLTRAEAIQNTQELTDAAIKNLENNISGIYLLCRIDSTGLTHCYVGQSLEIKDRLKKHINIVKALIKQPKTDKNKSSYIYNDSPALHSAMVKYGYTSFKFIILEKCARDSKKLDLLEKEYIKKYGTYDNDWDYNLTEGGQFGVTTNGTAVEQWEIEDSGHNGSQTRKPLVWIKVIATYKSIIEAARTVSTSNPETTRKKISNALWDSTGTVKLYNAPNRTACKFGWRKI